MQIYKLLHRGRPSALVAYLSLYYELTPIFRDILPKKKIKLSPFLPVTLKGHIGAYLAN